MSRVRIHNFSISLDGFATGEGQALDTPFGHAGHRLHEWLFATRFAHREVLGESGGTEGFDHAMADRHGPGIGVEIMGAGISFYAIAVGAIPEDSGEIVLVERRKMLRWVELHGDE